MEQQTVSIAKAGHCNSLPARCAVLSAANPVDGRYDVNKSVMANMNMPAALLTRFDLQFLILDVPDKTKDRQKAIHILNVIRGKDKKFQLFEPISGPVYRRFISKCKECKPVLPQAVAEEIAEYYAEARNLEVQQESTSMDDRTSYTTPRSVIAILRMCQALARLRMSSAVESADFYEARRLIDASKHSVTCKEAKKRADVPSQIYELIRRLWKTHTNRYGRRTEGLSLEEVERQAVVQGFKKRALDSVIEMYVESTVLYFNDAKSHIRVAEDSGDEDSQDGDAEQ
eukprot:GHVS01018784.1.p1 GENE.GHVS01018784.1~~GHVS01018784.1.p1  ORF type:complete len:306 (-),score=37.32 GHVS01018784.1:312-1169(-)